MQWSLYTWQYGIVLDAGSSHTSVFIYEWPAEKENNTGMVQQKHTCNVKGEWEILLDAYFGSCFSFSFFSVCERDRPLKIENCHHLLTPPSL